MQESIYQKFLHLENAALTRIDHNEAMVALVYKVEIPKGKTMILKIFDRADDYLREVHFLDYFSDTLPIPKIIKTVEPNETLHGAILMEYLDGALLQPDNLTEELTYEIGRALALIHLNSLAGYGDPIQKNLNEDPMIYYTFKFVEGLDECIDHLPTEIIEACRDYYNAHVELLSTVDGPCVVHRDYRPGNIMVKEGRLQGIIDWSSTRASFAEEDFCLVEQGEWLKNADIKNVFLSGYASVRPVPDYQRMLTFLKLNRAIATIGFLVKRGTWNTSGKKLYQIHRQFLETLI